MEEGLRGKQGFLATKDSTMFAPQYFADQPKNVAGLIPQKPMMPQPMLLPC